MGQQASCREVDVTVAAPPAVHKKARRIHIMLLGDSCVGKSSLVQRLRGETFETSMVSVGLQFTSQEVEVCGDLVEAQVVDTPGLERFQAATFRYFPLAACMGVTYSVTDRASFDHVKDWAQTIEIHGDGRAFHMLLANKADLGEERVVSEEEGRALARSLGLNFFEMSAKTGQNVEAAFASMASTAELRMLELQDATVASGQRSAVPVTSRSASEGSSRGRRSAQSRRRCRVQPAPGLSARLPALS